MSRIAALLSSTLTLVIALCTSVHTAPWQSPGSKADRKNSKKSAKNDDAKSERKGPDLEALRSLRVMVGAERVIQRGLPSGLGGPKPRIDGRPNFDFLVAVSLLAISGPLQDELELTPTQQSRLRTIHEEVLRQRGQILFVAADLELTAAEQKALMAETKMRSLKLEQETDASYRKLLKQAQIKRLEQVMLQIKGPLAVADPEIADAIGLEPDQLQQVQRIVEEMFDARSQLQRNGAGNRAAGNATAKDADTTGRTGRGAPQPKKGAGASKANGDRSRADGGDEKLVDSGAGAAGSESGTGGAGADAISKSAAGEQLPPEAKPARLAEDREKYLNGSEQLREAAIKQVSSVLTTGQRAAFNRMLGKTIPDISALIPDRGAALRGTVGFTYAPVTRRDFESSDKPAAKSPGSAAVKKR